jgi:hypothetical protein
MKIDEKDLGEVAGGRVVETKGGKFVPLPDGDASDLFPELDTAEDAEKWANAKHKGHFGNGPHHHSHHCKSKMTPDCPKPE